MPDTAKHSVDKTGDLIDEGTGGKYADKVDIAHDKSRDFTDRQDPPRP
ncbi:antitoxin [Streptomyces sp. NPDC050732]